MTKTQKAITLPALGLLVLAGGVLATYGELASAQTGDTNASGTQPTSLVQKLGGHIGLNGIKEELLTGEVAEKVTASALLAQPGATVDRVETDAEGADYEAHMTKVDGSHITLKFDKSYAVTATEDGPHGR